MTNPKSVDVCTAAEFARPVLTVAFPPAAAYSTVPLYLPKYGPAPNAFSPTPAGFHRRIRISFLAPHSQMDFVSIPRGGGHGRLGLDFC